VWEKSEKPSKNIVNINIAVADLKNTDFSNSTKTAKPIF
jgi:hypothetical protein